jgi:hypothetical protein
VAFADIADTTATNLQLFAVVDVYDRDSDTTTTLYLSEGDTHTDQVDGTVRDWDGRIDGWKQTDSDQKIGTSRWAHPNASITVYLGNQVGDAADDLWDYLTDDHVWYRQSFTLYLVDMSQAWTSTSVNGSRIIHRGKISARPSNLREGAHFSLRSEGNLWRERIPLRKTSIASKWRCGFVQPVLWTGLNSQLTANVNATQTTFTVSGTGDMYAGQVCMVCDAGTGNNDELLFVESVVGLTFEAVRGYQGSTASAHSIDDWCYNMAPGPAQGSPTDGASEQVIPIVQGRGLADRGIHDLTSYLLSRQYRTVAGAIEAWASSAKGPVVMETWDNEGGVISSLTPGNAGTFNDWDDVGGFALPWGDPILSGTSYHLDPHPIPTGTYFYSGVGPSAYKAGTINVWARISGITRDDSEGGTLVQSPAGTVKFLIENAYAGLGLTLADEVDDDRIDGWNSGDWADEYSENYWTEVACVLPAFGASDAPYTMDAIQEACDLVNSDCFVSGGKLYPKRRTVAATADLTVEDYHLAGNRPTRLDDPQDTYCNVLTPKWSQPLWSEPSGNDDPVSIPMESIIGDDDEIALVGEVFEKKLSRAWFYMNLQQDWIQQTTPAASLQTQHLNTWNVVHQEQLAMRAQPQIYIRATVQENCTWLQQGHTVDFNVPGITTAKGQVRQVERSRPSSGNGPRRPIRTEIESWHISFP